MWPFLASGVFVLQKLSLLFLPLVAKEIDQI